MAASKKRAQLTPAQDSGRLARENATLTGRIRTLEAEARELRQYRETAAGILRDSHRRAEAAEELARSGRAKFEATLPGGIAITVTAGA